MIIKQAPRDRLRERPEQRALPVEPEFVAQAIQAPEHLSPPVSKFGPANDGGDAELALPGEWFGIDREPGFALGAQDITRVQVLVQKHLLSLRSRQRSQRVERRIE
jgi:hypothetical protein